VLVGAVPIGEHLRPSVRFLLLLLPGRGLLRDVTELVVVHAQKIDDLFLTRLHRVVKRGHAILACIIS